MRAPSYDLSALKNHFDSVDKLRMTRTARESAIRLGFDDYEVIEVIQELKNETSTNRCHRKKFLLLVNKTYTKHIGRDCTYT